MKKRKQKTIKTAVSYSGIGIHTGQEVTMRFCPAEPNSGIYFKRVDLDGAPIVEASLDNVFDTSRSTNIQKGVARIYTVEHVMAALHSHGVDNLCIELNGIEPPIGNGSSDVFVEMLEKAQVVEQDAEIVVKTIKEPVYLTDGDVHLVVLPDDVLRASYTLSYPQNKVLGCQYHSLEVTKESFCSELAPCRTFALYEEISFLMDRGLIKGGSLDNAVVVKEDAVLSKGGLFFEDEMVRHKILDLIGDLSLMQIPFTGHIISIKSGHTTNYHFAKKLRAKLIEGDRPMSTNVENAQTLLDTKEILKILPHRYPFLLVDKIVDLDVEKGMITGQKNLTMNESFFQGHFPGAPIMPGVLMLEALAQTGGVLLHLKQNPNKIAVLLNVNNAKFRHPARPGDVLKLHAEGVLFSSKGGKIKARATVDGKTACEAEIGFAFLEKENV